MENDANPSLAKRYESVHEEYLRAFEVRHDMATGYLRLLLGCERIDVVTRDGDSFPFNDLRYDIDSDADTSYWDKWRRIEKNAVFSVGGEGQRMSFREYCETQRQTGRQQADAEERPDTSRKKHYGNGVYSQLRNMPEKSELSLPKEKWNAARSAAAAMKRMFGVVYRVNSGNNDIITVRRLS